MANEALILNPIWADLCTGMESDLFALQTFAIFDPPIALTVESRLVPLPVSADPTTTRVLAQAEPPVGPTIDPAINPTADSTIDLGENSVLSSNAARPAPSPVNTASPVRTGDQVADSPRPSLAKDPNDPVIPESWPTVPLLTPTKNNGADPSVDSKAPQLEGAAATPKPVLTFAGSVYTAGDFNDFNIGGETLTKGGVIVVDGTQLSINPSGTNVIIGSSTQALSFPINTAGSEQRQVLTFHGSTYTADGSSNFIVDGQTLAQGSAITAEGNQISYDQAGSRVIVGGTGTQILATTRVIGPEKETILTFDGSTYTADSSSNFIIDGHTLSKGGIITVDGTRLSYDPKGSEVVIGTSTQSLATPGANTPQEETLLTFNGSTFTADSYSDFVIDGQTLSKGAIITADGTRLSYNQQGSAIVIGTSTQALSFATITPAPTPTPIITFDGSTFYANDASSSELVIDGQTLTKGGVVTVHGTPISYTMGGTDVVVGTNTEAVGLGGLIMGGFSGSGGKANNNEPVQFTGKAARNIRVTEAYWVLLWGLAGLRTIMGYAMS